jgi:DNA-binding NarL/FixJ family response regulator
MTVITKKVNVFSALKTNVLDDDIEMNELVKEVFEMHGLPNIEFFTDSDVFVQSLNENIHLCIVDQSIPGSRLQGLDVIRIIKERFPKCQVIFLSGTDDPKILREVIRLRPEGYVYKSGNYVTELVEETVKCLSEIKKNLELAIAFENYQKHHGRQ